MGKKKKEEELIELTETKEDENKGIILPLLPLRGLTIFPYMVLHFDVGREKSIKALEKSMVLNQLIFLVSQKEEIQENPKPEDLYEVGTISRIKQILKLPGDTVRVLVEGISRASIIKYIQTEEYFEVELKEDEQEKNSNTLEMEAMMRSVLEAFEDFVHANPKFPQETLSSLSNIEDPGEFADVVAANILVKQDDKQAILECLSIFERMEKLLTILKREIEIQEIETKINLRVRRQIDKNQKDFFLREQVKAIQKELGEQDGVLSEVEELNKRLNLLTLPEEVNQKVKKELDRMSKMQTGSPEVAVIRTYVEWILDLPWETETEDNLDLKNALKILDKNHYGLKKVKDRILEYLAIRKLKNDMKGPIICFVGPPGVGKTSIAMSIAKALNRKFVRFSLGGVRDEAEIRGHRRTYVGAMPGRIINGMKLAGSINPVFLFDEIDKMSSDFRGDPASAMLEILDSEQNYAFRDHYLELPFDLSKVMFITTANSADTIPRPLLDRMEIIQISSYTYEEKQGIAIKHLIPKQLKEHGLTKNNISISTTAISSIINNYTSEAGVRSLERQIATICRKAAREVAEDKETKISITVKNLEDYLGIPKYTYDIIEGKDEVGMVTGLAWTVVGGQTLTVEVTSMQGTGKLELTGKLGDVMKESAKAGYSYIRASSDKLGITDKFYEDKDIHIHIPEGAIPKDGPSAGVTMATAIISALTGKPVRKDVAMTGEITLRGRVLPVGGLNEKILAAKRAGIKTVIVPKDNKKDISEIDKDIIDKIEIVYAENMDEVLKKALR